MSAPSRNADGDDASSPTRSHMQPATTSSSGNMSNQRSSSKTTSAPIQEGPYPVIRSLVAGGVAGAVAKTCVAPIERVKILFQINTQQHKNISIVSSLKWIWRHEGYRAYWKGNTANCARVIPYASVQYLSYEQFKRLLYPSDPDAQVSTFTRVITGSSAGLTAVICTYPLDLVRSRLVCQVKIKKYNGIADCFRTILHEEGWRALYKGMKPTMLGVVPYAGINFCTYETLKVAALSVPALCVPKSKQSNASKQKNHDKDPGKPHAVHEMDLRVTTRLMCGGVAGAIGQTVVYPLDTVRRRMQMDGFIDGQPAGKYSGKWTTVLSDIYKSEGWRGLYRGISVNYIRVVPLVSISFTVYDSMKKLLGLYR